MGNIKYENRTKKFAFHDSAHSKASLTFPQHLHYHIELVMLEEGECEITVDGKTDVARGGDIFITFPHQLHSYKTLSVEKYSVAIISPEMVPEFQKTLTTCRPSESIIHGAALRNDIKSLIKNITDTFYSKETYKDFILRGYVLSLFGKILPMLDLNTINATELNVLDTIMNFCVNNSEKPLSLEILEKELHISKYYISRIMREKLNVGFNDYVNSLRISNACIYLLRTNMSITEISTAVGFNSIRTFNRAFVKQMSVSPREYRANAF